MKTTLLLTASAPGLNGVGGVLIQDMLASDTVPPVALAGLIPESAGDGIDRTWLSSVAMFPPPSEHYEPSTGRLRQTAQKFRQHRRRYDSQIHRLAQDVRQFAAQAGTQQVWAILNSLSCIDTCYQMMAACNDEWIIQIWDDPLHLAVQRNLDRFHRKRTMARFDSILKNASRVGVICEEMQQAYQSKTRAECVIVRHGLDCANLVPQSEPARDSEFRIGFSGSMYSFSAWKALEAALDQLNWTIADRQVVLIVVGGKITFTSRENADCRFYGWRSVDETRALMASCDLLYLPQAFESHQKPLTQLSFPTKVSTYVATGRPVLVHTPEYGSLTRFCRQHGFGLLCNSLQPRDLAHLIRQLAMDQNARQTQAQASVRVASNVLTQSSFSRGVHQLLGIPATAAEPAMIDS